MLEQVRIHPLNTLTFDHTTIFLLRLTLTQTQRDLDLVVFALFPKPGYLQVNVMIMFQKHIAVKSAVRLVLLSVPKESLMPIVLPVVFVAPTIQNQ